MSVDMPPQIPPVVIEYVKKHDFGTGKFKNLNNDNAGMYIHLEENKYRGYTIYYIGNVTSDYFKYKNCKILLKNQKEIRYATELEKYEIIYYRNDSYKPEIPTFIVEYAKEHDYLPDLFKGIDSINAYMYISPKKVKYRGYIVYLLGYIESNYYNTYYIYRNCKILLHNSSETRCANKTETHEIEYSKYYSNESEIPVNIIEYAKEHDYLPEPFEDIDEDNAYMYIAKSQNTYKDYNIYQLGYKYYPFYSLAFAVPKRKNCYFILDNSAETKCASKEEGEEIVQRYPELSPSGINPVVIDFVRKYGNIPKNFDDFPMLARLMKDKGINPDEFKEINIYNAYPYIMHSDIGYKKYDFYYLGFPYIHKYEKHRCQFVLQNENEVRCATRREYYDIIHYIKHR